MYFLYVPLYIVCYFIYLILCDIVITLRRWRPRPHEQLLLQNYKA